MKISRSLALVSLFAVAAVSFAQKAPAKAKTPEKIACAVMQSMKVDVKTATKKKMFTDYKGRRYFFCCPGCPPQFKKNPDKYSKNPSIKAPKA